MKALALTAIRFYQQVISPRKGFCCAYCAFTGHASCSALGYRAIRRFGVWHGLQVLNARLRKCGIVYRRHQPIRKTMTSAQAGFCDCDCGSAPCEVSDCSWGSEKKKNRRSATADRDVVIPPRRTG